ncbi:MAG: LacI family DNA-binding transcriptional regulator [Dehalococcoidia bacterium]
MVHPQSEPPRRPTAKAPTLREVARRASVSPITASRVLHNHPSVSPGIRRAVLDAVAELGYRPNAAARELRSPRSRSIGVLMPDLAYHSYWDGIRAIESHAELSGYSVFLGDSARDSMREAAILERFLSRRVAGIVANLLDEPPAIFQTILDEGIPIVLESGQPVLPHPNLLSVPVNSAPAIQSALALLRGYGHSDVALVTTAGSFVQRDRVQIATEYASASGMSLSVYHLEPRTAEASDLSPELTRPDAPTAVFVLNYDLTALTLAAVADAGLHPPESISVIVSGDSYWLKAVRPPLSVVRGVGHARGIFVAQQLLNLIEGRPTAPVPTFDREFVNRGSVGPRPDRTMRRDAAPHISPIRRPA